MVALKERKAVCWEVFEECSKGLFHVSFQSIIDSHFLWLFGLYM